MLPFLDILGHRVPTYALSFVVTAVLSYTTLQWLIRDEAPGPGRATAKMAVVSAIASMAVLLVGERLFPTAQFSFLWVAMLACLLQVGWLVVARTTYPIWHFSSQVTAGAVAFGTFKVVGCLLAGCCFARRGAGGFTARFSESSAAGVEYGGTIHLFPIQLAEGALGVILFVGLHAMYRRGLHKWVLLVGPPSFVVVRQLLFGEMRESIVPHGTWAAMVVAAVLALASWTLVKWTDEGRWGAPLVAVVVFGLAVLGLGPQPAGTPRTTEAPEAPRDRPPTTESALSPPVFAGGAPESRPLPWDDLDPPQEFVVEEPIGVDEQTDAEPSAWGFKPGLINGYVLDTEGAAVPQARVLSPDCGYHFMSYDGRFFGEADDAEECSFIAVRRDGVFSCQSEPVFVQLDPHGETDVVIVLPADSVAGIGIEFAGDELGYAIVDLLESGPAWDSSLRAGDIIVAVNHEPTSGMDASTFRERMLGAAGSDVEVTYVRDDGEGGSEHSTVVTRRVIESPSEEL